MRLWTRAEIPEEHQATDLKILGIHDRNETMNNGTTSSASGKNVSIVFQPDSTGLYYISVGSGSGDRTGVYTISAELTSDT